MPKTKSSQPRPEAVYYRFMVGRRRKVVHTMTTSDPSGAIVAIDFDRLGRMIGVEIIGGELGKL